MQEITFMGKENKGGSRCISKPNRMLGRLFCLLFLAFVIDTGSRAQEVTSNFMPGADSSKYHTYKWVAIEGGAHPNQIMDQEIKQAVDPQLTSKGLTKADSDKADLYVGYQVAVDQEKQWNAWGTGRGFGGGMGSATISATGL